MTAVTSTMTLQVPTARTTAGPRSRTGGLAALATLARRRLAISAHTPRELLVPLVPPLLFALVVVPALADTFGAPNQTAQGRAPTSAGVPKRAHIST